MKLASPLVIALPARSEYVPARPRVTSSIGAALVRVPEVKRVAKRVAKIAGAIQSTLDLFMGINSLKKYAATP
jgi:hypothetical protein